MTADEHSRLSDPAETTIVYVDDDESTADEVLAALRDELPSAAIEHVGDAERILQSDLDGVDCFVSADQLAETAGVNLVRAVRESSADVPVLLYGAPDNPAEISAAFDAGATDYLQRVGDAAPTALARKVAALVDLEEDRRRVAGETAEGETGEREADEREAGERETGQASTAPPPASALPTEEYRVIAEIAADAIVTIDEGSRIRYANPAVEDVFGYEPEELVGERLTALMPDDLVQEHREGISRYLETGERTVDWSYLELPGVRKDGTEVPLSVSFGEFEREGRHFFAGIIRDVSERKRLEETLREERNLNRRIVETSPVGIVTLDADGEFTSANERAEEILGRSKEEIDELSYDDPEWDLVGPDGTPLPAEETTFARVAETGESVYDVEFGIKRPDGERRWLSVSGEPITDDGEITGAVAAVEDVTERKQLEETLREERNLNRQIVETSPVGITIADRDGRFTFANEHAERIVGQELDSVDSVSASASELNLVGPDGDSMSEEEMPFAQVVETGEPVYEAEIGLERPDGERVWILMNAAPMFGADGALTDVVFAFQDITEQKRLSGELREIYGRVTDAFYALDDQWRFTHANDRAEELIDYRGTGLVGENFWDVFEWAEASKLGREYREAMATQEPTSFEVYYPEPLEAWFEINAYPSETGLSVYFRDVTERKERERDLEEARQRFRTIVEHFPNGAVALVDEDLRYVTFGGTPEGDNDLTREDLEGEPIREALPQELGDVVIPRYEAALAGESAEFETSIGDGVYQFHFVPVRDDEGDVFAAMGMSQDVTERRKRERDLQEERDLNERIVETSPVGIVTLDADGSLDIVNGRAEEILGLARDELDRLAGGSEELDVVTPEGEPIEEAEMPTRAVFLEGESIHDRELGLRRPDAEDVWVSVSGTPLFDDEGDVSGAVITFADVTERRERERALRERERQLERHTEYTDDVLDAVDDVFYVLDEEANFKRWNESLTDVTGYSDDEIESIQSPQLFAEKDQQRVVDVVAECFETGTAQLEAPFLTKDGESIPYEFVATRLEDPEGEPVVAGIGRDISDRRAREAELQEYVQQQHALSQLRRKALEDVDLDDLFAEAVERVADVLGHEYAKVLELQRGGDELLLRSGVGWDEGIAGSATVDTRENSQAGYTLQESGPVVVEHLDSETRFTGPDLLTSHDVSGGISVTVGPRDNPWGVLGTHTTDRREYDDHEVEFVQHVADLLATAIQRERYETQMAALSGVNRLLMEVETPESVCETLAEAADGDLGLPIAVVALYDDQSGRLRPAGATALGERLRAQTDLLDVESGPAWEAFVNDERRTDSPDRRVDLDAEPVHLRERVALPLGKHGVLLVGVAGEGTMPEPQVDFLETVTATVRAALDRADREATLRDREATLQSRNEDLERLARLNEVVRGIERALVGASTRSEIESAVCEQLATVEPYGLAWIGRPDAGTDRLRRAAAAGDRGYLDDLDPTGDAADDPEPSVAAAASDEMRVVERIHDEPPLSNWRQEALRHGFSSAVGVPIEYGGYRYGILTVYGTRRDLFDQRERETILDLVDTIAYAINAVESKRALVGDEVVELELELSDPDAFVFQFLAEHGGTFEFENVFLQDGPGMRTLFSAADVAPDAVAEYAERSPFVENLRQITEDDQPLYECTLSESGFIPRLYDHGARPQQLSATGEGARLIVELPTTVDVRGFVEMLESLFDGVELMARRERTLETRSRREFQADLDDRLTDRQREVLRTAYFSGFFETPRRRTGKEIGAALDISQPTFNHHLRAAQRKLFDLLYGSADAGAETE